MRCPSCGTDNPAQARFCMGCGRLLVSGHVCANCHTLLPAQARFCFHCGAIVVPLACPQCGAAIVAGQEQCSACGTPLTPTLLPSAPSPAEREGVRAVPAAGGQEPGVRPLPDMLPSLRRFLPEKLYEPLERWPTEEDMEAAIQRLRLVLETAKTYLPWPVVQAPQPAGVPAGHMRRGTFLFGDVSGFTPLSERLSRFGKQGAEEITRIINDLFNDLVATLHEHGGTLLKFGGDALLGLFAAEDDEEMAAAALRAVQSAQAMQGRMARFANIEAGGQTFPLRIKCGLASGPFFAAHLGTPQQMVYVTTGHTVNRADQSEGHAAPGDVIIAQDTLDLLGKAVEVEQRAAGFYAVRSVPALSEAVARPQIDEAPAGAALARLSYLVERLERLAPYLAAEVLPRIVTNPDRVEMPPDHRLVTVMFVNYLGISDLIDDLGSTRPDLITRHFNDYFVHMARIVEYYGGTVARMDQYSQGDRLVAFFGAPRAHEDDPERAVHAALDIREATRAHFAALQTPGGLYRFRQRSGINTGNLFAGNVGAPGIRQEYTLMGDGINMAARLMSKADWGEIFISKRTQEWVSRHFELEDRGELKVKGKEILIPTFQVVGRRAEAGRAAGRPAAPLIGRDDALEVLRGRAQDLLLRGRGQVVAIVGDGGLGKTRLLQELREWLLEDGSWKLEGAESLSERTAADGTSSSAIQLPTSNFQPPTSNFQPPTSNLQLPTSNLQLPTSNLQLPTSNLQPPTWLDGQALSFSEQTSYWLAVQVLQGMLDLQTGMSADDILYALWERGEALLGKETAKRAVPFLAHLLDLPLRDEWAQWVLDLDPKVRQKQTFWAAREFFTAAARRQPIVIALDDLHWADEASLALFEDLLWVTDHAPLMFCLVFRPRRDKGCWRLRDRAAAEYPHRFTEVELGPLDEAHSRQLLGLLLPGVESTPAGQDILDKSAGNPFYIAEVVDSLKESGAAQPDVAHFGCWTIAGEKIQVPDTLQAAIVARIDRLTEDARQALQMAAVIGRRFQRELLRNLAQAEEQLDSWLSQLERSGLIRPAEAVTETAYAFPDALVQEVAYESLLFQRRQLFHRRIGEALEELFRGREEEGCELLAYHYSRSDNHEAAIKYLEMAGRKAQAQFANETAVRHYTELLERLGAGEEVWEQRFDVLNRRQHLYGLLSSQEARQADLEAMQRLVEAHPNPARRSDVLNAQADLYQWTGRYAEAEQAAREALDIKSALGDRAGQAAALHQLGVLSYYRGDYEQARPLLERAVALRRETADAEGETWSLMYLYMIHLMQGNYAQAAELAAYALEVAQARQDWFQQGIHLTNAARISLRLGEYERAIAQFQESLETKGRVGDRMGQGFSLYGLGLAHTYLDHYDEAEAAFQSSLALRQKINDERGIGYCWHGLGLVALGRGQFAQAEEHLRQAYEIRSRLGLKAEMIADLSYLAQAHLHLGRLEEAAQASGQAIALLVEQKNVEEVQQIYLNHYRVLAAQGDPTAAAFWRQAHDAMLEQARRLPEGEKRQSFLDKVRANQAIRAAEPRQTGEVK